MKRKFRIVQHVSGFERIGGPASQLRLLLRSRIVDRYEIAVVSQDKPAKGINLSLILEMARAIQRFKPDIVHVRGLQNEGFHGVLAARLSKCNKILVSVHGFAEDTISISPLRRWLFQQVIEPLTLRLAGGVYCVCSSAAERPLIRKHARRNYGVIYNGVECVPPRGQDYALRRQLGVSENEVVALYTGRITRDKGLFVLADAMRQLKNPPVLWLAGDGPDMNELRTLLGPLVESGRVRLLGSRNDIPALLSACDYFVSPTLHENLSNAVLEAMCAERAVLTTSVGGNLELVIDGKTGRLVTPQSVSSLVEGIETFTTQPELRKCMGLQGRKRVDEYFSIQQTVEKLTNVYEAMLE
jgi:glycosyltransferase involved in cell wall biosynthesis